MILCCGEALIDMIPAEGASGAPGFTPFPGGAVFNTAIALGRLGCSTGFVSGLSRDLFGQQLLAALADSGVDTGSAILSDRPTTLAFVQLTDGQATYTFYDENTAGRQLDRAQLPEIPEAVRAMFFGGISLISEPCADFYADLAVREAQRRVIAVDPNIRAGFITNEAAYRKRLDRIISVADIVKVSDEDLNWLIHEPVTLKEKAARLQTMGPGLVILTRGGAGASALMPDGGWIDVAAPQVEVADTVGAGDTFNAGVLARLGEAGHLTKAGLARIQASDIEAALHYGARVAAITVSRSGANPPWARELGREGAGG